MTASIDACNDDVQVRVMSRCLMKASDFTTEPHIIIVSNLDLMPQSIHFIINLNLVPQSIHLSMVVREASVAEVLTMPLLDVAAMAYDRHFQELVDWVEEHKTKQYIETATLGLGSPMMSMPAFTLLRIDTDFGIGRTAMTTPLATSNVRLCLGFVQITKHPRVDGSSIIDTFLWPRFTAALEVDEPRVFNPVTAEYLGLVETLKGQQS